MVAALWLRAACRFAFGADARPQRLFLAFVLSVGAILLLLQVLDVRYARKLRSIHGKGGGVGENMNETNLYAVMTIMAFAVLLPVSLLVETPKAVGSAINAAVAAGTSKKDLAILSALSGAYYYLYNEVAFLALGRVNPVTHAVGNTIKRVVIIIASVIAFNTPISRLGVIGSSIAITGTLLYSLAKNKYG